MKESLDDIVVDIVQNEPYSANQNRVEIPPGLRHRQGMKYDALVLDAQLRQSLVTVRSLGCRDKYVAALEVSDLVKKAKYVPTFSSHWCHSSYVAPSFEHNTEPYLKYLFQVIDNTGASVLITSSDGTLALLRKHRDILERRVHIALAKESALEVVINKDQTLEIAKHLGLGIPGERNGEGRERGPCCNS